MNIALVIGLAALGWAIYTFNRLIQLRQLGDNAWSDIDVQLKRRHDLIPNVVAVVQGHAGYEKGTLEAVVAARGRAIQASQSGPATRAREEDPLANALQRVLVVAEAYPELKAAASFASLQVTLTEVEDHLQNARRYYNAVVRDFNTAIAQFPAAILAGMMRLKPREFFGLDDSSEGAAPTVSPTIVLLLIALSTTSLAAQGKSYYIRNFDARIGVNKDASIDVTETITAHFVGSWNGLYRTIPTEYRTPQGLNWTLRIALQDVRDAKGGLLRTETSREGASVKYKIWIPGAVNTERTIVLRYHATNALRFFDEHDELYWNVTGDEWTVPIRKATAQIDLPVGTPGVHAIAYNGIYGSTARDAKITIAGNSVRLAMPQALEFHEGLTAVVGWDKGVVTAPTFMDRAGAIAGSNWPLLIPLPVFLFAFMRWRRYGRDPDRRPIAAQYEPPAGMTPAEAGTLIDNSVDMRDITATLMDLAVRGYIRIEERENPKTFGLFGGGTSYRLHQLKSRDGLKPHESDVYGGIFDMTHQGVVSLDDMDGGFYQQLNPIRDDIWNQLIESGLYKNRPEKVKRNAVGSGLLWALLIALGGSLISPLFLLTPVPFIVAALLSAIIFLWFAQYMPSRTEPGARALEQVLGFAEFLQRVDADHFKQVVLGHPELFDKFLPYAIAFGVDERFARAFDGIYTEPPRWYAGSNLTSFNVTQLSRQVSTLQNLLRTTMTSTPRSVGTTWYSSSSSGSWGDGGGGSSSPKVSWGSGFGGGGKSGGGGFSGGGGGGGGGGAF